jgi:hypothetical protein
MSCVMESLKFLFVSLPLRRISENRHKRQRPGELRTHGPRRWAPLAPREPSSVQRQSKHGDFNGTWTWRSAGKYFDGIACSERFVFYCFCMTYVSANMKQNFFRLSEPLLCPAAGDCTKSAPAHENVNWRKQFFTSQERDKKSRNCNASGQQQFVVD